MIYGYARVSTTDQTLDGQIDQLKAAGCDAIYSEKQSGAKRDRAELDALLAALNTGDVVIVTRLDRLARTTLDMLNIVQTIAQAGASLKPLAEPWADTTSPAGQMIITIMAGVAQFERDLIISRTSEGRTRAKAKGVRFGRPKALSGKRLTEALKMADAQGVKHAAQVFQVSESTIRRLRRKPQGGI